MSGSSGDDAAGPPGQPSVIGSSAVMAAGTVVSRFSGYVRATLLIAALGNGLHADVFNIANTIPNMLYILLAGGVFNAVLVPQLVRAIRNDPDRGAAYTNRVITLAGCFLAVVSILLVVASPLVMRLVLHPDYFTPAFSGQRDAAIVFARYCMPQVFFYGMFVLVGQVLNARGSFGPMMWAPIANNLISVAVLVGYLLAYGPTSGAEQSGGFSSAQEAVLGIGSTLGIAAQLVILVPYLRRAGIVFRPRFDFRGSGLGHTFRLGLWTVLFVVVNQIAFTVVVRLASTGTARDLTGSSAGTGFTVYSNAYLLAMVPHAIITVSLATAVLPRLSSYAAAADLGSVARSVLETLRSTYALVLPILALLPLVATDLANVVFKYGAGNATFTRFVPSLALFSIAIFFFTSHYLVLRGFYALEQNRRVFFIQCVIAVTNIVAAVLLTRNVPASEISPRLVIAYALSYAVGAVLSYHQLSAALGGLGGRSLVRFAVRITVVVSLSTALAWIARAGIDHAVTGDAKISALVRLAVVGLAGTGSYLVIARALRLEEVGDVVAAFAQRFSRRSPRRR